VYFDIVRTVHCVVLLIYKANFICTKIYTHQTLVNPHVSARHRCHHQGGPLSR